MDNTLKNGTKLKNGSFEIKKHINSGAFGIIYLVEDTKNGNKRAIKELFIDKYCSRKDNGVCIDFERCKEIKRDYDNSCQIFKSLKEDMKSEVEIIQNINSNKILKIYEWFEENDTIYLIMEYIEGKNLKAILNRDIDYMFEAFPEIEMEKLLQDLCEAINILHKNGYVHRDIKPENIMRDKNGQYRLIDFSTIKKIDTEVTYEVGTPHFKPPEYNNSFRKFYKSSDIYSLGMTIYHILKGGNPPPDYVDRREARVEENFQNSIKSLEILRKDRKRLIDDKLKNMIKKMTNLNPKERYQDMKELGREIKCGTVISNIFLALLKYLYKSREEYYDFNQRLYKNY